MSDDDGSSTGFELTRRRILGGIGTIGAASAAAGAGTFAYFSDTESSTGNTVSAGTLDLSGGTASYNVPAAGLAPSEMTSTWSWDLTNNGSIGGDHVEVGALNLGSNDGSEPSDNALDGSVSKEEFARRLFISKLKYEDSDGNQVPVGWSWSAASDLLQNPGALVIDTGQDSSLDVHLERSSDPVSGSNKDGVVHIHSNGVNTKDYAITMRETSLALSTDSGAGVTSGDVTYNFYKGSDTGSVPDEAWLVVEDAGGTRHLLFNSENISGSGWQTRDVGAEIAGTDSYDGGGTYWYEITSGGYTQISDDDLNVAFDDGTVQAVGAARGGPNAEGSGPILDAYYADLDTKNYTSPKPFRPVSLADFLRSSIDGLTGIPADGTTRTFKLQFTLDSLAGNAFQADGVSFDIKFGLAQTSGQDIL